MLKITGATAEQVPMIRPPQLLFILTAVGLLVFGQNLSHGLLYWDDLKNICENPGLFPIEKASVLSFWSKPYFEFYIPVSYSAWWLLTQTGNLLGLGGNCSDYAPLYHLASIGLHVLNAFLTGRLIEKILPRDGKFSAPTAAAFGALIFLLHPLQVESVAWATGLRDLLSYTFSITATLLYFSKKPRPLTFALFFFALALLAKPGAVLFPALIFLIDVLLYATPPAKTCLKLAPWTALAVATVVGTLSLQTPATHWLHPDFSQRLQLSLFSLGFYLFKVFVPYPLVAAYPYSIQNLTSGTELQKMAGLAVALILTSLIALKQKGPRLLLLAFAVFLLELLPVSGLFSFSYQYISQVADRFTYPAMLGIALAASYLLLVSPRKIGSGLAWLTLATYAVLSFHQASFWQSDKTLFEHSVEKAPGSSTAEGNLGHSLYRLGESPLAESHLRASLRLDPQNQESAITLGDLLESESREVEAIALYREILTSRNWASIHNNLGQALMHTGHIEEATRHYLTAIEIDPTLQEPRFNLGAIYLSQGRLAEAEGYFASLPPHFPLLDHQLKMLEEAKATGSLHSTTSRTK